MLVKKQILEVHTSCSPYLFKHTCCSTGCRSL